MIDRIELKRMLRVRLDDEEASFIMNQSKNILGWINQYNMGSHMIEGEEWAIHMISHVFTENLTCHVSAPWWYREVNKVLGYDRIHKT
jgi:hypothetical protein